MLLAGGPAGHSPRSATVHGLGGPPAKCPPMNAANKVRTCLWFEKGGEEAARFYVTLLPDSHIESSYRPDPDGPALVLDFTLGGAPYQILNGGPEVSQSPAVSISVVTEDQAETDRLWEGTHQQDGGKRRSLRVADRSLGRLLADRPARR